MTAKRVNPINLSRNFFGEIKCGYCEAPIRFSHDNIYQCDKCYCQYIVIEMSTDEEAKQKRHEELDCYNRLRGTGILRMVMPGNPPRMVIL